MNNQKQLNKYERLFWQIHSATKKNEMTWKLISKHSNSDLIFNPGLVFRQFQSELTKSDETYKVLFVEKKAITPDSDFEKYYPEILIIDENNEIIASLNNSLIEESDLYSLTELIEGKSDKAKKLFEVD